MANSAAIHETPPEVPEGLLVATHWIYVINEDYDFERSEECVILYDNYNYNPRQELGSLRHKTLVAVHPNFRSIGRNNLHAKLKVVDPASPHADQIGFTYMENLRALEPDLPTSFVRCRNGAPIGAKVEDFSSITARDWYETTEPFYDENVCRYCVNVSTLYTTTGGNNDPGMFLRKREALVTGRKRLLNFYNKSLAPLSMEKYLNSQVFMSVESWYMDPDRPQSNLQFLVTSPSKYFDAIPEREILASDLDAPDRVVVFDSFKIRNQIKNITEQFESFEEDLDWKKFKYKYTGPADSGYGIINFKKEARKIEVFFARIQKLLNLNDHSLREEGKKNLPSAQSCPDDVLGDRIEIGFSLDYEIKYVFYDDGTGAISLNKGIDHFKQEEPFSLSRTCAYMFYMFEMNSDNELTWKRVLKSYTYPMPELKHTANRCVETYSDKLSCIETDERFDTFSKARNTLKRFEKSFLKLGKPRKTPDLDALIGAADDFREAFKPAKTAEAVQKEILDVKNLQVLLDGKMDSHYDDIAEGLLAILIAQIREFQDCFICTLPNIPEWNLLYKDLIVKMPDIVIDWHKLACIMLEMTRLYFEESAATGLGATERELQSSAKVIEITALETGMGCRDICKVLPIVCQIPGNWFPPTLTLPEIPTIDIMGLFMRELEKITFCAIFGIITDMSINMLELLLVKGNRFPFDDLNAKTQLIEDLDVALNETKIQEALTNAGVNIFRTCEGFDIDIPDEELEE